jgi:predicted nucleic acid-binding protein
VSYLLDTNVLSELRKSARQIHHSVSRWASAQLPEDLFVSVVSIFELEIGVLRKERGDPWQGGRLRAWLEQDVVEAFRGRVLDIDLRTARRAAGLHVPDPQPDRDAFIAATAKVHDLTVVTRNEADFTPLGIEVLNPWS